MRDDFTESVKRKLALRVGYLCSNPNCRKQTIGPGSIAPETVNIGVAAHITAASEGGKRYNSILSASLRKHFDNGIWLCANCGKLIDSDESHYTIDLLKEWKNISETAARNKLSGDANKPSKINLTTIEGTIASEKTLFSYNERFISFYKKDIKNFIPVECAFENQNVLSDVIPVLISASSNNLIIGESGFGKTLIAKQSGIHAAESGSVPIYVEAKYFDKSLENLIEKEVSTLTTSNLKSLLNSCKSLGREIVLIVDGYNECSNAVRHKLIRSIITLKNRIAFNVIIVSQYKDENIGVFEWNIIKVHAPSFETKRAIALLTVEEEAMHLIEPIIAAAHSGMEAKIIGEIGSENVVGISRFSLFDLFVRKKTGDISKEAIALLIRIAGYLSETITFSLTIRELDKLLQQANLPNQILQLLLKENILKRHLDKISFYHEQFQNAFTAASIIDLSKNNFQFIISAINSPKNYDKKTLIIGAIDDILTHQSVLEGLNDPDLVISLLHGEGGLYCKQWIINKYTALFKKIYLEADTVEFELLDDEMHPVQICSNSLQTWSAQELSFISALSQFLFEGLFLYEIFHAISLIDKNIDRHFDLLVESVKGKRIALKGSLFATVYIPFTQRQFSLSLIFSGISSGFYSSDKKLKSLKGFLISIQESQNLSNGALYFILDLIRFSDAAKLLFEVIEHKILTEWKHLPYHLKLQLLDSVVYCWETDAQRLLLIDAIQKLPNDSNIFISTNIVDALHGLGALEEDETNYEDTVKEEIKNLFAHRNNPNACKYAFNVYSSQFDHPYDGAYYNVISKLNGEEKYAFLEMAILGADSGFFVTTLLFDYFEIAGIKGGEKLRKWLLVPTFETLLKEEEITIFMIAHILIARTGLDIQSRLYTYESNFSNGLCACAEIFYWINRNDIELETRKKFCNNAWDFLNTRGSNIAMDCIHRTIHGVKNMRYDQRLSTPSLASIDNIFPEWVANVCRKTINSPDLVEVSSQWDSREKLICKAIQMLSYVGSLIDIPMLKGIVEHPEFGINAVNTIKSLEGSYKNPY